MRFARNFTITNDRRSGNASDFRFFALFYENKCEKIRRQMAGFVFAVKTYRP